ncbi:hypothetical protein K4F52_000142 [Lecanicillium sp. MT-2017a]|nr:hypothetical protein K4F52_000142 [Lecanicillium sp. MT-2017a]
MDVEPWSMERRLRSRKFIAEDAAAAVHELRLPLHLGRPVVQYAVVCGIRSNFAFATGEAAALSGRKPIFTRAINARLIMSKIIPQMSSSCEMPCCIWYPDLPSADTLLELARRHPDMLYQAARACAVGGFTEPYRQLGALPEVAVAEEAREAGITQIYDDIMKASVKWKVFDDYQGKLQAPVPAHLNGDTFVRRELDLKQDILEPMGRLDWEEGDSEPDDDHHSFFNDPYGYIHQPRHQVLEGVNLDAPKVWTREGQSDYEWTKIEDEQNFETQRQKRVTSERSLMLALLANPLPADLPTLNKALLIFMAVYHGNIERYSRLRRPRMGRTELYYVIRGIYHNTMFAKWWSTQDPTRFKEEIQAPIIARFIMNEDISWALRKVGSSLPELIHFPDIAAPSTYKALAKLVPRMRNSTLHAAIYANYKDVFDFVLGLDSPAITLRPITRLVAEAKDSPNSHYLEVLLQLAKEHEMTDDEVKGKIGTGTRLRWRNVSTRENLTRMTYVSNRAPEPPDLYSACNSSSLYPITIAEEHVGALYNGFGVDARSLERYLSLPESWLPLEEEFPEIGESLDYENWPE